MQDIQLLLPILLVAGHCYAQNKKNIKKRNIKSVSEYVNETINGQTIRYLDVYREYDRNGYVLTEIQYNRNGTIKKKEINTYNRYNNKIESTEYDSTGFVHRITYSYTADGEKEKEIFYDKNCAIIKEIAYIYNAKELKTEKRITNNKQLLESIRSWVYEFYK